MEYLSEIEKLKIESFCKDEVMREAVRKVLLAGVYENGTLKPGQKAEPRRNAALSLALAAINTGEELSNEKLGADLRAFAHGVTVVEGAFLQMDKIKASPIASTNKDVNPAL